MGDSRDNGAANDGSQSPALKHPAVRALAAVLIVECIGLVAAVVFLAIELLVAPAASLPSAIAITVIVAVAAVWVAFIAVGVLRGRAWTRAAVVVVQVLVGAVAIGSFQGANARPDLGILLLVPVVTALVLLFTPPVLAAISTRDEGSRTY